MEKQTQSSNASASNQQPFSKKVGDAIEKVGDKIEHSGFKRTGDAIEKVGDRIEHLSDRKNKNGSGYQAGQSTASSPEWAAPINARIEEFEGKVQQFIRTKPVIVLAGALALGYIANRLMSSKKGGWMHGSSKLN